MQNYIQRLKDGCTKGQFVLWWVFRVLMIYALIATLLKEPFDISLTVQLIAAFAGTFLWEMCMATKENSFTRFIPSFLQTGFIICIFVSAFLGEFMGLYDSVFWLGYATQFIFGGVSVFFGYEIACTFIKRDRYYATKAMAFYVAFGLFFVWLNVAELSEFFLDQVVGLLTPQPGNAQNWLNEAGEISDKMLLHPVAPDRFAIMDTMTDIILSTIGAFVGLLIVNIFPYRHRGKHKYDFEFSKKDNVQGTELKN